MPVGGRRPTGTTMPKIKIGGTYQRPGGSPIQMPVGGKPPTGRKLNPAKPYLKTVPRVYGVQTRATVKRVRLAGPRGAR
jgi:hypothetical protein